MKKLLAILLAMAMLLSFGAIGAAALTPEEELLALGRALLEETLAVFDSNYYTLLCKCGSIYAQEGDRIVIEDRQWTESFLLRRLAGDVELEIITPKQNLVLLPKWRSFFNMSLMMRLFGDLNQFYLETSNYFGSVAMLEYLPLKVEKQELFEGTYITVLLGDNTTDFCVLYVYLDGQLKRIAGSPTPYSSCELAVESLIPEADLSQYNTKGMFKLPNIIFFLLFFLEIFP